ncbi:MAG: hypothetical protein JNM31_06810 [Flavobacteriales bacterium]|nr:hypothetical protein [Flavobacteriales bacterium]
MAPVSCDPHKIIKALALFICLGLAMAMRAQTPLWAVSMGGSLQDFATSVAVDGAGNVLVAGVFNTFNNSIDLDPGPGIFSVAAVNNSQDVFLVKLDPMGNFLWAATWGGNTTDECWAVTVDAWDNVIIGARVAGTIDLDPGPGTAWVTTTNTTFDAMVVKLSPLGAFIWGKTWGSANTETVYGLATDAAGSIYATGSVGNLTDLDPGPGVSNVGGNGQQDIYVQKLDANGDFVWGLGLGGTANDMGWGIAVSPAGEAVVTGEFRNTVDFDPGPGLLSLASAGDADIFVLRLSVVGTLQWAHRLGGTSTERARSIAMDSQGACIFTGFINSVTDMDPGPGVLNLTGNFTEPSFLTKLNAAGQFEWSFILTSYLNFGGCVRVDAQDNVYTTGKFGTTGSLQLDIDPGPGVTLLAGSAPSNTYVLSYTAAGSLRWGFHLAGGSTQSGSGVAVASDGSVHVAKGFVNTTDVDPGPAVQSLTSAGLLDILVVKYTQPGCTTGTVALRAFLQGPYNPADQLMSDALRVQGLVPLNEPYSAMAMAPISGPSGTTGAALAVTGPNAIVDWVLVELRDPGTPTLVLDRRAALIQRDGDVVDVDGISPVPFCDVHGQALHVALRHRNHLGVMTTNTFVLGAGPISLDLTAGSVPLFGTDAQDVLSGTHLLWQGNVLPDALVKYSGPANDRDPILARIGGVVPTAMVNGYWPEDVNMDGTVKYTGTQNDRDPILLTIGGVVTTNTRTEQLP